MPLRTSLVLDLVVISLCFLDVVLRWTLSPSATARAGLRVQIEMCVFLCNAYFTLPIPWLRVVGGGGSERERETEIKTEGEGGEGKREIKYNHGMNIHVQNRMLHYPQQDIHVQFHAMPHTSIL